MPDAHRDGDARTCGASTTVAGQGTVYVNDQLWSVDGDPNSHGMGNLINGIASTVFVEDIGVIVVGDSAVPDLEGHVDPKAVSGSGDVSAH